MTLEIRNTNDAFNKRVQVTEALIEALLSKTKQGMVWEHDQSQTNAPYPVYTLRKELAPYGRVTLVLQRNENREERECFRLRIFHGEEQIAFTEETSRTDTECQNDLRDLYNAAAANSAHTTDEESDIAILNALLKEFEAAKPADIPNPFLYEGIDPPTGIPFPVDILLHLLILFARRNGSSIKWNRVEAPGHLPAFYVDMGELGRLSMFREEEIQGVSHRYTITIRNQKEVITLTDSDLIHPDNDLLELYSLLFLFKKKP